VQDAAPEFGTSRRFIYGFVELLLVPEDATSGATLPYPYLEEFDPKDEDERMYLAMTGRCVIGIFRNQ